MELLDNIPNSLKDVCLLACELQILQQLNTYIARKVVSNLIKI